MCSSACSDVFCALTCPWLFPIIDNGASRFFINRDGGPYDLSSTDRSNFEFAQAEFELRNPSLTVSSPSYFLSLEQSIPRAVLANVGPKIWKKSLQIVGVSHLVLGLLYGFFNTVVFCMGRYEPRESVAQKEAAMEREMREMEQREAGKKKNIV